MIMHSFLSAFVQHNYFEICPYWTCRLLLVLCSSFFILGKSLKPMQLKVRSMDRLVAFASPRILLAMQNLRPHHSPTTQNLHFHRIPGINVCTLKFEKPCLQLSGPQFVSFLSFFVDCIVELITLS